MGVVTLFPPMPALKAILIARASVRSLPLIKQYKESWSIQFEALHGEHPSQITLTYLFSRWAGFVHCPCIPRMLHERAAACNEQLQSA
eukprot:2717724-Amphidinium_carterae.1